MVYIVTYRANNVASSRWKAKQKCFYLMEGTHSFSLIKFPGMEKGSTWIRIMCSLTEFGTKVSSWVRWFILMAPNTLEFYLFWMLMLIVITTQMITSFLEIIEFNIQMVKILLVLWKEILIKGLKLMEKDLSKSARMLSVEVNLRITSLLGQWLTWKTR